MEASSFLNELNDVDKGFLDYLFVIGKNNLMHEPSSGIANIEVKLIIRVFKVPVFVFSLANRFESNKRISLCNLVFSQHASLGYLAS